MTYADAAPQPSGFGPWLVLCAGLSCLFLVSAVVLVLVLRRRSRTGA